MTHQSRRYLFFVELAYSFEILRPLQAAARARGAQVAWYLNGPEAAALRPDERRLHNVGEVAAFQADAVFVPGNEVPPGFPGLKVQVFHGFGIEKKGHFRIRGMFDLFCTFGPLTTLPFQRLAERHGWFRVVETGWPKVDPLFAGVPATRSPGSGHILYAPTFSPSLTSTTALAATLAELVARRDWHWTVKFHPKMDAALAAPIRALAGPRLHISAAPDLLPLLHDCDVMLTDTSSAAAECMLLDKPVLAFRNRKPGPHLLNLDQAGELEPALDAVFAGRDPAAAGRHEYIRAMHPYRDGRSSERVLDAVETMLAEGHRGLKRKPWSLLRRFKYWRRLS